MTDEAQHGPQNGAPETEVNVVHSVANMAHALGTFAIQQGAPAEEVLIGLSAGYLSVARCHERPEETARYLRILADQVPISEELVAEAERKRTGE